MKIIRHRLHQDDGTPYAFRTSPNKGGKVEHEYLVMHYTAGRDAESTIRTLTDSKYKASAHLVISRDGAITQLVPFDTAAWHAGISSWEGREGLNRLSLGIELDNAGALTRHGARWRAWFGAEYDDEEVIEAAHKHDTTPRGWHLYTPEQLDATLDVATLLVARYGLRDVVGHDDIAPGRKTDPGPAFPMQSFRARVLGRADDMPVRYETTTNLNIRSGPGTQHPPIPGSPLPTGTRVLILAEDDSWRRVDVLGSVNGVMDVQGWVHGRYLQRAS
jgi:N-acetylmuramoyl-L-alanine amidase